MRVAPQWAQTVIIWIRFPCASSSGSTGWPWISG